MSDVIGIHHVAIAVPDIELARRFYVVMARHDRGSFPEIVIRRQTSPQPKFQIARLILIMRKIVAAHTEFTEES